MRNIKENAQDDSINTCCLFVSPINEQQQFNDKPFNESLQPNLTIHPWADVPNILPEFLA